MVINRRGLSNTRIARVAFTALLFTAYFVLYAVNKNDTTLWSPPTPTSPVLNKAVPHNNSQRFSNSIELNVQRGLNIINMLSGQHMAAWIYVGRNDVPSLFQTWKNAPREKMLYEPNDAAKMKDDDTIWVSSSASVKLYEFATDFLPYINTTFALITTSFHGSPRNMESIAPCIVSHPYLLGWFATDMGKYTGGYHFHPKVFPFPLGLKSNMGGKLKFRNPLGYYRDIFLELWNETNKNETELQAVYKTTDIFAGYLAETNASRKGLPSGLKLDYPEFLRHVAKAKYVLSPNGDHPDCHRHYEAIGLGAIPITQLDPFLYSHLKEGPVVYQNDNWDIGHLRSTLPMDFQSPTRQMINRNLIFEEYWMEYVESATGKRLRWWDLTQKKQVTLDMFDV
mmetsp:Transcript_24214/g.39423  ORF Transcript_24214/g.39423 Transcript_24214/m.39423 type:complete len:396 (-) Transcript_24214:397-1584(-)|eukprot:scaffold26683_cov155-Skeletonema_menzelii.AAC.7